MRPSSILIRTSGVLLLVLGCLLRDPYLLPVRSWALPTILTAGAMVTLWLLAKDKADLPTLVVWAAVLIVPAGFEVHFTLRKCHLLAQGEPAKTLGGHFMVGYARIEDVEPLAEKGLIGGIYVGRQNIASLQRDIARLQALRRANGLPPLIVATDQEGGLVSRLSPLLTRLPPLSTLAELPANQRADVARAYGYFQGSEMAAVGITVDFSPVVDLKGAAVRWDRNSFIARRAISGDPTIVGDVAEAYARGLRGAGILPTLKHFPGLGRVQGDTHHVRVRLSASTSDLEAADWIPFRRLLADGPALLMVGHVILDSVDPLQPASRSRAVIDGLIRQQWGFQGGIITDDLTMPSVFHHDFCQAVTGALDAGADLLLLSYDGDQYYRALDCALESLRQGRLPHFRPVASPPQALKNAAPTAKSTETSARYYVAEL